MTQEQVQMLTRHVEIVRINARHTLEDGCPQAQMLSAGLGRHADAVEALLAEREELLKDKARLDWVGSNEAVEIYQGQHPSITLNYGKRLIPLREGSKARSAIDAAMKGEQ